MKLRKKFAIGAFLTLVATTMLVAARRQISSTRSDGNEPLWFCGGPYDRCQPRDTATGNDVDVNYSKIYRLRQFEPESLYIWASPRKNPEQGEKYGLLRSNGTWVIEPTFAIVGPIKDGMAVVCLPGPSPRCGGASADGKIQVPLSDQRIFPWENGFAVTEKNRKYGLIDKKNTVIVENKFDRIEIGKPGSPHTVEIDGKRFHLNDDGSLGNAEIEHVVASCPDGPWAVQKDGVARIRRSDGNYEDTPIDNLYLTFKIPCGNGFQALSKGKLAYFDANGKRIASSVDIDGGTGFKNGHAAVRVSGLWGIMNEEGSFTVKPQYSLITLDADGTFKATRGSSSASIDHLGRSIEKIVDQRTQTSIQIDCAQSKIFHEIKNGVRLWGIKADDGREIVPADYLAIECFRGGITWTPDPISRKWCPTGPKGRRRDIDCVVARYALPTHTIPVVESTDPYEASVMWARKGLEFASGLSTDRIYVKGDGIQSYTPSTPY